ncbi:ATP-binding cassette sub-family A member 10-like [Tachyglossus aculeatus]|uniref:ATP-binding cassette sub-family A member 10-like n=1 Tax=Tachyglossus aculeatus TaxID=9261 RepID=UPI0018F4E796|nr:ATP-binding cassette sub-family A member 10-like [Tachyglossus aculeatus]
MLHAISIMHCIGFIQHPKSKFGRGDVLEMKAKETGQMEALHTEILWLVSQTTLRERSPLIAAVLPHSLRWEPRFCWWSDEL